MEKIDKSDVEMWKLKAHKADAVVRFYIHKKGDYLSEKFKYGNVKGMDAVARFLLERDGTPVNVTLSTSTELIDTQIQGVADDCNDNTYDFSSLSVDDNIKYRQLIIGARMAYMVEKYGERLIEINGYKFINNGVEAVCYYLTNKLGLSLSYLRSLNPSELSGYLVEELSDKSFKLDVPVLLN